MNLPNITQAIPTFRLDSLGIPRPYTYYVTIRNSGSDYIERNGLALVSLIEEMNRQLEEAGSTEELVIVGPSMAGQIARYALAYMEANNIPHNTRLYIALDSPHNGANVPIGLQRFVRHYADDTKDTKLVSALEAVDAPASREMVSQHYNFNNNNDDVTAFAPHPDRIAFMNTLNALRPGGFPSNVRRVAVTNGALNGAAQQDQNSRNITDSGQAFLLEQRGVPNAGVGSAIAALTPFAPISLGAATITTASARVYFSSGYGNTTRTLRTYKITTGERLYDATGPTGSCGLDASPGGYRKFIKEVSEGNGNTGFFYFNARTFYSVRERATFIPMLSALGCTNAGYNNCTGTNTRWLVCNNATPFDAYYGPARINEEHTQLTSGNVEFLRNEILKKSPRPILAGPQFIDICSATSARPVFASVLPECLLAGRNQPSTTYTWRVTEPGVLFLDAATNTTSTVATGSTVQLVGQPGIDGDVRMIVTGTRAGYAVSEPTEQYAHVVSNHTFTMDYAAPNGYPHNNYVPATETVNFMLTLGGIDLASIRWTLNGVPTNAVTTNGQGNVFINVGNGVGLGSPRVSIIRATGTSLCDESERSAQLMLNLGTGPGYDPNRKHGSVELQTYPNPVQDEVSIVVTEPAATARTNASAVATVRLYDTYGHMVRQMSATGLRFSLITKGLLAGLYDLVVVRGAEVLRKHIEISN